MISRRTCAEVGRLEVDDGLPSRAVHVGPYANNLGSPGGGVPPMKEGPPQSHDRFKVLGRARRRRFSGPRPTSGWRTTAAVGGAQTRPRRHPRRLGGVPSRKEVEHKVSSSLCTWQTSAPTRSSLHSAIPGATLAVLSGLGHECSPESADTFDAEVRRFLLARR